MSFKQPIRTANTPKSLLVCTPRYFQHISTAICKLVRHSQSRTRSTPLHLPHHHHRAAFRRHPPPSHPASPSQFALMSGSTDQRPPVSEIFKKAGKRALGGGIPGAVAMGAQVLTLMPLRSTMNYQYRYGNSTTATAIRTLYADGGVRRFYRGIGPALFQGPLSRFGDTAANSGMLTLLDSFDNTKNLPVGVKTAAASGAAASWRIFLMRMFRAHFSIVR